MRCFLLSQYFVLVGRMDLIELQVNIQFAKILNLSYVLRLELKNRKLILE
jgi:hypothetical protein